MHLPNEKASVSCLRKHLEYCYDKELWANAILIGNMLDIKQCLLLKKEQEKASCGNSTTRLSFELIHA